MVRYSKPKQMLELAQAIGFEVSPMPATTFAMSSYSTRTLPVLRYSG